MGNSKFRLEHNSEELKPSEAQLLPVSLYGCRILHEKLYVNACSPFINYFQTIAAVK